MAAAGVERLRALLPDERRTRVLVNKALSGQTGEVPWIAGIARVIAELGGRRADDPGD